MVKKTMQKIQSDNPIVKRLIQAGITLMCALILTFTGWVSHGIIEAKETKNAVSFNKESIGKNGTKLEKIDDKVDKIDNRTAAMEQTLKMIYKMVEKNGVAK